MRDISDAVNILDHRVSLPAPLSAAQGAVLSAGPDEPEAGNPLHDLLDVVRRWGWLCLLASVIICPIAVGLVLRFFVPRYTATAMLEIRSQPYYVAFAPANDNSATMAFAETQLQVIRSPVVLGRVAAKEEINRLPEAVEAESTITWLKKNLKVGYAGTSELCEISFKSGDAQTAATVANAIMFAYLDRQREQRALRTEVIIKKLEMEKTGREEEVRQLQQRLRLLTTAATGHDPGMVTSGTLIIQPNALMSIQQALAEQEVELAVLETELAALENVDGGGNVSEADIQTTLAQHPDVRDFDAAILAQQYHLRKVRGKARLGDKDQQVMKLKAELAEMQSSRADLLNDLRPYVVKDLQSTPVGQIADPRVARAKILRTKKLIEMWRQRANEEKDRAGKIGDESLEIEFARSELRRSEEVFQKIADRIVVLRTEQDAPAQAAEMHQASKPPMPDETIPARNLAMAVFGSLGCPIGLAFLWERLQKRISDKRHVTASGNVMVLGEVAILPSRRAAERTRVNDRARRERFAFAESINSLRVSLTHTPAFRDVRTLAVTSATSAEGKTTLASSLASSVARSSGQPALLVDADLRSPDAHNVFNLPLEPGLVDVLEKRCSLEDAIVADPITGLHVLPAGRLASSPHLLLGSERLRSVLDEFKSRYRYVVVDTPPTLIASEAVLVASACDGAVICAMHDMSRQSHMRLACERLSLAGARLLGAVISGVPTRRWSQRYGGTGYAADDYALAAIAPVADQNGTIVLDP